MAAAVADRNLLFGLLALQNGLINQVQLVAAFQAWTLDKARALADHLISLGHLNDAQRAVVEAMADLHVAKHGDVEQSLAAIPAGRSTRESLAQLGDPDIEGTLAHVRSRSTEPDGEADPDRTATYSVGSATSEGHRFRVLRPHARGGLGAVFVALDEELHREVALKQILDRHADDSTSRQRFLLEAEVTGGLEHPGIVPVYGLGTYADGRPYYAMRFVRGDSLKEAIEHYHADVPPKHNPGRRSLELRKLLRRFLDVCNAIAYAHSRGVLHRDIKPGNIIVGKHGETLVVDWGLAKATGRSEPGAEERTLVPSSASGSAETLPGSALGTPAYMSPEQARGDLEHLGPQSDVYSLGATLYCLLTGRPPAEGDDVGAVLRAVQRAGFPTPRSLDTTIDRALEAVCLKAMALRPEDRYTTPRALAEDVERWMADEPVSAWREPRWRRLGRWGRRHKPVVAGAAALLIAAVVGLSVGTILINRERAEAEESFRQARAAVDEYFTTVSESKLLDVPGLQPLRKELLDSALRYYQNFLRRRAGDPSVRAEAAAASYRVAIITNAIGTQEDTLVAFRRAVALYEELVHSHPTVAKYLSDLAISYFDLANLQGDRGRLDEALDTHRKALSLREALARDHPTGARYQNELSKSCGNLGDVLRRLGRPAEALPFTRKAVEINDRLVREDPAVIEFPTDIGRRYNTVKTFRMDFALDLNQFGLVCNALGQTAQAVEAGRRACAVMEALARDFPADIEIQSRLAGVYNDSAALMDNSGHQDEALRSLRRACEIREQLVASNPTVTGFSADLALSEANLGSVLYTQGHAEEGLRSALKGRAHWEELVAGHPDVSRYRNELARTCSTIGQIYYETDRPAEATPFVHRARDLLERLVADHPENSEYRSLLGRSYYNVGWLERKAGKPHEALRQFRRAREIEEKQAESSGEHYYMLACLWALCIPPGSDGPGARDAAEGRRCAEAAMDALRRALAVGFGDIAWLGRDPDLDALRSRADFRELFGQLTKARPVAGDAQGR